MSNEKIVAEAMANHDKHYWALVQVLKRKKKNAHDLADLVGEGSTVASAIWNKYENFDFTKPDPAGEPPQPRCPDCKSVKLSLAFSFSELRVTCENSHRTGVHIAADLAKFFGPSAPQSQPSNCILCGCQKEKAVIHQPSGQFVCMDCRDAARRGYAESGPSAPSGSAGQGPEECTCKKPDFQHAICPVHDTEAAAMMGLGPEGRAESPEKRLEQEFDDYEDA